MINKEQMYKLHSEFINLELEKIWNNNKHKPTETTIAYVHGACDMLNKVTCHIITLLDAANERKRNLIKNYNLSDTKDLKLINAACNKLNFEKQVKDVIFFGKDLSLEEQVETILHHFENLPTVYDFDDKLYKLAELADEYAYSDDATNAICCAMDIITNKEV